MTQAPHLENGIAAEVRELVERLRIKAARFRASPGTDMYYGCGEARDGELAADMLERLALRPSADHEAVRQRAVEDELREELNWHIQLLDKIEDQLNEFGTEALPIVGETIGEWRHARAALRKPANVNVFPANEGQGLPLQEPDVPGRS